MRVAQNEMPSRMFGRVTSRLRQHFGPMIQLWVIAVHEFGLAVMNRFAANVDVGACEKVEPELRFTAAHVRHGVTLAPLIAVPQQERLNTSPA